MSATSGTLGALGLGADMSRYLLPLSPFILMFAAVGWSAIIKRLNHGNTR